MTLRAVLISSLYGAIFLSTPVLARQVYVSENQGKSFAWAYDPENFYTNAEAVADCGTFAYGGRLWRVPSRQEIETSFPERFLRGRKVYFWTNDCNQSSCQAAYVADDQVQGFVELQKDDPQSEVCITEWDSNTGPDF